MKIRNDLIFNGSFKKEYTHPGEGECPYCFLVFAHTHKEGTTLREFIMNKPKNCETWENRFDKDFPFGSFAGSSVKASEIKDFIRREFI